MAGRSSRSRSASAPRNSGSSSHNHSRASVPNQNVHPVSTAPAPVTVAAPIQQPGFFSGIVQTAVGTTIGHTVGRAVTNMLGLNGPSYSAPPVQNETVSTTPTLDKAALCEPHFKSFMTCMDKNNQDMSACQYYLDMLKSCRGESSTTATASW